MYYIFRGCRAGATPHPVSGYPSSNSWLQLALTTCTLRHCTQSLCFNNCLPNNATVNCKLIPLFVLNRVIIVEKTRTLRHLQGNEFLKKLKLILRLHFLLICLLQMKMKPVLLTCTMGYCSITTNIHTIRKRYVICTFLG